MFCHKTQKMYKLGFFAKAIQTNSFLYTRLSPLAIVDIGDTFMKHVKSFHTI